MGEASRREQFDRFVKEATKQLTDQGRLIEAGWVAYQMIVMPKDAGPVQIEQTRTAFFAGAEHLFASIISILDPGAEPTEADLSRMEQINEELKAFRGTLAQQHYPTKGSA